MTQPDTNQPCPHCGRYDNRAATVDTVVIKDERILLIRRGNEPYKDYWALPGGYMDPDETAEEAARREAQEETGLELGDMTFVGTYTEPERHPQQAISIAYKGEYKSGKAHAADDAIEARWFPLDSLPEHLGFDHRKIIADAI